MPRDAYLRFIPRTEMDIAVVGAAVNLTLDAKGVCTDARVALGAVAPTALLVEEAAEALIGHALDERPLETLDAAARARLQADRRQARHHRVPHQDRRRADAPRRRHRVRPRQGRDASQTH